MKKNSKGFTLVETLIVSTFVVGTLVFLFTQFVTLQKSYNRSFKYNTVPTIYAAKNIRKYLNSRESGNISLGDSNYRVITCSDVTNGTYCSKLYTLTNIKHVIITTSYNDLSNTIKNDNNYSEELYQFLLTTKSPDGEQKLIVECEEDGIISVASIKMGGAD